MRETRGTLPRVRSRFSSARARASHARIGGPSTLGGVGSRACTPCFRRGRVIRRHVSCSPYHVQRLPRARVILPSMKPPTAAAARRPAERRGRTQREVALAALRPAVRAARLQAARLRAARLRVVQRVRACQREGARARARAGAAARRREAARARARAEAPAASWAIAEQPRERARAGTATAPTGAKVPGAATSQVARSATFRRKVERMRSR